jgi:tol-pal system protein YbgF
MLLVCLCWGCASPQDMANLQQSINILFDRVNKLEERMQGMGGQDQRSAELFARIEEMQVKLGGLSGRVEELQRQVDRSAAAELTASPSSYDRPSAPTVSAPQAAPGSSARQPETPKIVIQEEPDPEKAMYNSALKVYQDGNYVEARREAQSFISRYPKSDLADNALFLIGEAYYSEKSYKEAIESYQQLLDRYPKANKVPSALQKQAASFKQLGDTTAARILYERLLQTYPGTPQAQIAEKELQQLR